MKPRDLLLSKLETRVAPHLAAIGFRFAPSKLSFSRKVAFARQEIAFSLDRWNFEDHCGFWTVWGASAPAYKKWHHEKFGVAPSNDALGGVSDWNIPGWSRRFIDQATLTNDRESDQSVVNQLVKDICDCGLPFLDQISTWEGAAENLVEQGWMYDRAADFLLIAGDPKRSQEILQIGVRQFTILGRRDNLDELPRLRARLNLFSKQSAG